MSDSTSTAPPSAVWAPIPLPPELVELVLKNREKIEALAMAGVFSTAYGKATVHLHDDLITGVQLETWTYQRRAQEKLSTGTHVATKRVPI